MFLSNMIRLVIELSAVYEKWWGGDKSLYFQSDKQIMTVQFLGILFLTS